MAGRTRRLDGQKRRMTMTYGAFLLLFLVTPIAVLAGVLRRRLLLRRLMLPALALPLLALATGALGPHRRRLGPVDVCTGPHLGRAGGPCRRRSISFACSKRCPKRTRRGPARTGADRRVAEPRATPLPAQAPVAGCAIRLPREVPREGYVAAHTGWRRRQPKRVLAAGARDDRRTRPTSGRAGGAGQRAARAVLSGLASPPGPPICRRSTRPYGPAPRGWLGPR